MGNYEELKAAVSSVIKTNGNQEITGNLMQNTLLSLINIVGENAQYAGVATPQTSPGTPDPNLFYIATEAGIYENFGNIQVLPDEVDILLWKNGSWTKQPTGIATKQSVTEIEQSNGIFLPNIIGLRKYLGTAHALTKEQTQKIFLELELNNYVPGDNVEGICIADGGFNVPYGTGVNIYEVLSGNVYGNRIEQFIVPYNGGVQIVKGNNGGYICVDTKLFPEITEEWGGNGAFSSNRIINTGLNDNVLISSYFPRISAYKLAIKKDANAFFDKTATYAPQIPFNDVNRFVHEVYIGSEEYDPEATYNMGFQWGHDTEFAVIINKYKSGISSRLAYFYGNVNEDNKPYLIYATNNPANVIVVTPKNAPHFNQIEPTGTMYLLNPSIFSTNNSPILNDLEKGINFDEKREVPGFKVDNEIFKSNYVNIPSKITAYAIAFRYLAKRTDQIYTIKAAIFRSNSTTCRCIVKAYNVIQNTPKIALDPFSDNDVSQGVVLLDKYTSPSDWIDDQTFLIKTNIRILKGQTLVVAFQDAVNKVSCNTYYVKNDGSLDYLGLWKPTTPDENFGEMSYYPATKLGYYQYPLEIMSFGITNEMFEELEEKVNNKSTAKINMVVPSHFYAVVGLEFNIYYDWLGFHGEYGNGIANIPLLFKCDVGVPSYRSFRFTPTADNIGEHELTINLVDAYGNIVETHTTTIVVVDNKNPTTVKRMLLVGDSTYADSNECAKVIYENLQTFGNTPIKMVGVKTNGEWAHEGQSGSTYAEDANGSTRYLMYVIGLTPDRLYNNTNTGNVLITISEGWVMEGRDGIVYTNKALGIGYIPVFYRQRPAGANIVEFSGEVDFRGVGGTVTVTNTVMAPSYSVFKNAANGIPGTGVLDFAYYRTKVLGLASNEYIDLLHLDFGINDVSTISQQQKIPTDAEIKAIVDNEDKLIAAFLADNPNGKVVSACVKGSVSSMNQDKGHYAYMLGQLMLRAEQIKRYDYNTANPNVFVSPSGLAIDRWYGYPRKQVPAATRIATEITVSADNVHPSAEGYAQVADSICGVVLNLLQ